MSVRRTSRLVLAAALSSAVGFALLGPLTGEAPDLEGPIGSPDRGAPAAAPGDRISLRGAGDGPVRAAEVPVPEGATTRAADTFSMAAVTWDAETAAEAPEVEMRVRREHGWSEWIHLDPLTHGSHQEGARAGTELMWVDDSRAVQTRVSGGPSQRELVLIDPGPTSGAAPSSGAAGGADPAAASFAAADPAVRRTSASRSAGVHTAGLHGPLAARRIKKVDVPRPSMRTRKQWGANESWRNGGPWYNKRLKQVHVHHTASASSYTRDEVPGIIRGFYRYHTQSLGWSDIGYNFLVDRFGRKWVGRKGGPARKVRGAHTLGFNHQSTGIAVIGNFDNARMRWKTRRSVVRLAAWKLGRAGIAPRHKVTSRSQGSDRYEQGELVRLPAIDGHRDTNYTSCPGDKVYRKLPDIRERAARRLNKFR